MVYRGDVYFYQSGFSYSSNKRIRPGVVAITRTILQLCWSSRSCGRFISWREAITIKPR